jgi:hypothetical protein
MDRYKCPYKFAIDYLIRNGIKLEEKNNNFGRQVVKLAIEALEKQREKEVEKMKKYECLKLEGDAEIYEINGQYIKVVWGYSTGSEAGMHNTFDTNVCVYKWTGEDCTVDELPGAMDSDWKAVVGFDLSTKENSYGNPEVDWEEYAKKVDEILAEIEEEQTKEE